MVEFLPGTRLAFDEIQGCEEMQYLFDAICAVSRAASQRLASSLSCMARDQISEGGEFCNSASVNFCSSERGNQLSITSSLLAADLRVERI